MTAPSYPLILPTSPSNFTTSEWSIKRTVTVATSPFTYGSQSADLGGSQWVTTYEKGRCSGMASIFYAITWKNGYI